MRLERKFQFGRFASRGTWNTSRGVFIYLQQDKKAFPWVFTLILKQRHLYKHFVLRREQDAIFKPGPSGDQRAKVHSESTFLIAGVFSFALG